MPQLVIGARRSVKGRYLVYSGSFHIAIDVVVVTEFNLSYHGTDT